MLIVGDFDNDGFPDLLFTTQLSSQQGDTRISLLKSDTCTPLTCTKAQTEKGRRNFRQVDRAEFKVKDLVGAIFFDLDEDVFLI